MARLSTLYRQCKKKTTSKFEPLTSLKIYLNRYQNCVGRRHLLDGHVDTGRPLALGLSRRQLNELDSFHNYTEDITEK